MFKLKMSYDFPLLKIDLTPTVRWLTLDVRISADLKYQIVFSTLERRYYEITKIILSTM